MTNIDAVGASAAPSPPPKTNITVSFVTPGVDPVGSPDATSGSLAQNQFTYSGARPGVLRIILRARVNPSGHADEALKRVRFTVDKIPGSKLRWEHSAGGRATRVNGDLVETTATFTKLPKRNDHFGKKTATLLFDGAAIETREYLVFFPRDVRNHPGKKRTPNWFYYWQQIAIDKAGVSTPFRYGGPSGQMYGEVKGMTEWSYDRKRPARTIYLYDPVVTADQQYGVGILLSGVDHFIGTAIHEEKHTLQIVAANALVPRTRCWRFGYSWNQPTSNHWRSGHPEGKWGNPPIDISRVNTRPPLQIGAGADIYIDHPAWAMWPAVWPLPVVLAPHPIEQEACDTADQHMVADHKYARDDWADPGKNHLTVDKWDD